MQTREQSTEQRRHPRVRVERPCKVFHHRTGRYFPGITSDASAGGFLVRIESARPIGPGDRLDVLVAWSERVLLAKADGVEATVTRRLQTGEREQTVAVRFTQPRELAVSNAA